MTVMMTQTEIDAANEEAEYYRLLKRSVEAEELIIKLWGQGSLMPPRHCQAIWQVLGIDKDDQGAVHAVNMCRVAKIDGQRRIVIAWPAPRNWLWLSETWERKFPWIIVRKLIVWDVDRNTATLHPEWDDLTCLAGCFDRDGEAGQVYFDPRAWLQAWARRRAMFWRCRQNMIGNHWVKECDESDECPGVLAMAPPASVRWWSMGELPRHLVVHGADARDVNRSILKQSVLPVVRQGRTG